jgi:HAD superfamily hydrolase (TIGR01509 family)
VRRKTIRAVVFDLDGLLVDSEPIQFAAWDKFMASYGKRLSDDQKRRMYGTRLVDSARLVARELELPIGAADVAIERDAIFFEMIPGNMVPKPGAHDLLNELHRQRVPTALATSGHANYVDLALASANIPRRFDIEVTGDLVTHGKPHPETFLAAANMIGIDPSEMLVLEDSPQGVQAAVSAGAICFAIPDDPRREFVDLSNATVVLESLADVVPTLKRYGYRFSNSSQG